MTAEHEFCAQDWHRCWDGGGKGEYERYIGEYPPRHPGKKYSAKARAHARATELEARARNLSGMIAGLGEERTKCLIEAAVLRLAHR